MKKTCPVILLFLLSQTPESNHFLFAQSTSPTAPDAVKAAQVNAKAASDYAIALQKAADSLQKAVVVPDPAVTTCPMIDNVRPDICIEPIHVGDAGITVASFRRYFTNADNKPADDSAKTLQLNRVVDCKKEGNKCSNLNDSYDISLAAYENCVIGHPERTVLDAPISDTVISGTTSPLRLSLTKRLQAKDIVCVVETIKSDDARTNAIPPLQSQILSPVARENLMASPYQATTKSKLPVARIVGGIDVAAAASIDPTSNFLLDGSFDLPLSNRDTSLYENWWLSGYIRLASIAQPAAINGISTPATYIKPLTDSTPNNLVQSLDTNITGQWNISNKRNLGLTDNFGTFSAIVAVGFTTPLSTSQANPTVYTVNQLLYDYYKTAGDTAAEAAITNACPLAPGSTILPTCYVAFIPRDRSRFYRNYGGGIMFKRYHYKGGSGGNDDEARGNDSFEYPGTASITFGQNEYVTKGYLRGYVLHADAFWPVPGITSGKWGNTFYVFASIDTHLSKNSTSPQFSLASANASGSSVITTTSAQVANVYVQQPDRDRYRFGLGIDLKTLIGALAK